MAGASSALVDVDQAGVQTNTALAMLPIENLISNELANFAKRVVKNDNVMDVYLQTAPGTIRVGGGSLGTQDINALTIAVDLQQFIKDTLTRLDPLIDLDFRFITTKTNSDLDFYVDSDIQVGGSGTTLGIALSNSSSSRNWWELALNGPALQNQADYLRYATIHEFGHAMGLEHPFDNGDGDFYGSTNSGASAYPEDSVMSYRSPLGGSWPTWYSNNDIKALQEIWGVEQTTTNSNQTYLIYNSYSVDNSKNYNINIGNVSIVISGDISANSNKITSIVIDYSYLGTSNADILTGFNGANGELWAHDLIDGGEGNDFIGGGGGRDVLIGGKGNDELRGGYGHDILDGGLGSDILYGGGGRNTFINNNDGSIDQLFVLSDYHSHSQPTGRLHNGANADTISSLGVEDKIIILGASTSEISILRLTDGFGIFASGSLEAIVTDNSWNISSLATNVVGDATRFY